jgi:hypothetical protein
VNREERRRENEHVFRSANERLREVVEKRFAPPSARVPFLCECADETCMGRVDVTLEQYRDLRSHERRFIMLPDHQRTAGEEIVEQHDGYYITEKPE